MDALDLILDKVHPALGSSEIRPGMGTLFFRPSDPVTQVSTQYTFVIEKRVSEQADLLSSISVISSTMVALATCLIRVVLIV